MTKSGRYHGGLVFFGNQDQALDRFTRTVTATLEGYGHPVERQSILNHCQTRIVSSHYMVKLTLADMPGDDLHPRGSGKSTQRLVITLCPNEPYFDDKDISELLMVVILYRMVDIYPTRVIEWLDPDTVLTTDQFLGAFANVSPRRVQCREDPLDIVDIPFESVDDTEKGLSVLYDTITANTTIDGETDLIDFSDEEQLSMAYRFAPLKGETKVEATTPQEMAQSDIRRLATWGLTGMVAVLSGPVALSMAAVNLVHGEDFRLNTNVLSLTALLVMLQSTGAMASIVSHLPL